MLLRFFSLPPRLDATLAQAVSRVLPFSILLHLLFGMWMFSFPGFFEAGGITLEQNTTLSSLGEGDDEEEGGSSGAVSSVEGWFEDNLFREEVYNRCTHKNTIFFLIVFLLMLIDLVWFRIVAKVLRSYSSVISMFPCLENCLVKGVEEEGNPPFIEAISSEILGLQANLHLINRNIVEKYRNELDRRTSLKANYEPPERCISILETYNFEANQEYIQSFASDSSSIQAYRAKRRRQSDEAKKNKLPESEADGGGEVIEEEEEGEGGAVELAGPKETSL